VEFVSRVDESKNRGKSASRSRNGSPSPRGGSRTGAEQPGRRSVSPSKRLATSAKKSQQN